MIITRLQLTTSAVTMATARNVALSDVDADPTDGMLTFRFHRLLADFDGNDLIDRIDLDALGLHYHSQPGDESFDPTFDITEDQIIDRWDYALWRTRQGMTSDRYAPSIVAVLANDTGRSADDRITNDPELLGYVTDTSDITQVTAAWDNGAAFDILDRLDQGVFRFNSGATGLSGGWGTRRRPSPTGH